jgi:hypothetical protein
MRGARLVFWNSLIEYIREVAKLLKITTRCLDYASILRPTRM